MKSLQIIFMFFMCFPVDSQVFDSFSDGNFDQNPCWTGDVERFWVNEDFQLQSTATEASTSALFTRSTTMDNTHWECRLIFRYPTSSANYATIWLVSDTDSLCDNQNGYYVQLGGTPDEVSLYSKVGVKKTRLIDGADKRTDGKPVDITVRVERDEGGHFRLFTRLSGENQFRLEGEATNLQITQSRYFGLSYTNTSTTGDCYLFDDVKVEGRQGDDRTPPEWTDMVFRFPDTLRCSFSEAIDFSGFCFYIDRQAVPWWEMNVSGDLQHLLLIPDYPFDSATICEIELSGLRDLAGNPLDNPRRQLMFKQAAAPGDVLINEVMFHQPDSSFEYVEIINVSRYIIDCSGILIGVERFDGSLSSTRKVPPGMLLKPGEVVAFTEDAGQVRNYHLCPPTARILSTSWTALNNESSTLVLVSAEGNNVFDRFSYRKDMHHALIRDPKGVALERVFTDVDTDDPFNWHSAASVHRYGTPGFPNSQHRESIAPDEQWLTLEKNYFSPNNDGTDDLLVLYYQLSEPGWVAEIHVLTPTGERLYSLTRGTLLAMKGYFVWDGSSTSGTPVSPGIYVLYARIFHPEKGLSKQIKTALVLRPQ